MFVLNQNVALHISEMRLRIMQRSLFLGLIGVLIIKVLMMQSNPQGVSKLALEPKIPG